MNSMSATRSFLRVAAVAAAAVAVAGLTVPAHGATALASANPYLRTTDLPRLTAGTWTSVNSPEHGEYARCPLGAGSRTYRARTYSDGAGSTALSHVRTLRTVTSARTVFERYRTELLACSAQVAGGVRNTERLHLPARAGVQDGNLGALVDQGLAVRFPIDPAACMPRCSNGGYALLARVGTKVVFVELSSTRRISAGTGAHTGQKAIFRAAGVTGRF